ncbi:hypothetical protein KIN20_023018 [Parelaphostrongylus tenuis]|uniref:SOSS complex subunit A homolog n=1 Tax=Parelaphostrongylus tenuis TaxID=148309 RepID=A0AAD5QVS1_PARTN|nr:hypothetical protein KIN20_023018 [Parelaphostrongylus tenuis]
MDVGFVRRLKSLVVYRERYDQPPESACMFVTNSLTLEGKINILSEKDTADYLISVTLDKDRRDQVASGLLFYLLTDGVNFSKYFRYLSIIANDQWYAALCNVNMILFELWPKLQEPCRELLLQFFREIIKLNVPKIENVITNLVRSLNGSVEWNYKLRHAHVIASILSENEAWLINLRQGNYMPLSVLSTFGHLIIDIPPGGAFEDIRIALIQSFVFIVRNRSADAVLFGRELLLVLMRLAKIPQINSIWVDLITCPAKFGLNDGIEDLFRSSPSFYSVRLSAEMAKKLEFIICQCKPNAQDKHFEWFSNTFFRGPDGPSLRAETIRYVLYFFKPDMPTHVLEARGHFLLYLLTTIPPNSDVEQQWCKCAVWFDWLTYDVHTSVQFIEPVMSMIRQALVNVPMKATSLLEYVCRSISLICPARTELFKKAANDAMYAVHDYYGGGLLSILDNPRIERNVRDLIRETFADYFSRITAIPSPTIQPVTSVVPVPPPPQPPAIKSPTTTASNSNHTSVIKEKIQFKDEDKIKENDRTERDIVKQNKTPSPPNGTVIAEEEEIKKKQQEKEFDKAVERLRDDFKATMISLRETFRETEDESERGEAVQRLLQKLLESEDSIDEDQIEPVARSVQFVMGCPVGGSRRSILPDPVTEDALADCFTHPLFIIFRNLCYTPDTDATTRSLMVNMIATMRDYDNTVTYLMLFFIKANDGLSTDCISCYRDVARARGEEIETLLTADLQQCAVDDEQLFAFLVPYVFQKLDVEAGASASVFNVVCSHIDAHQIMRLIGEIIRENVTLFRKDSFAQIVYASLEWPTTAQWAFWYLVHAEGIPGEWLIQLLPKLKSSQHAEAIANVLLMLKRADRDPNMNMLRALFSRTPLSDDTFTIDCIKILIEDPSTCKRVSDNVGNLLKKQMAAGDLHIGACTKGASKKSPQKLSMEQVLAHLEHFTQLCLMKEKKIAEQIFSNPTVLEAFMEAEKNDKVAPLRSKFSQLFAVVNILRDESRDKEQSSRTLRGNRGSSASSSSSKTRHKDDDKDDDNVPKKKTRRVITTGSSSSSSEDSE